MNVKTENQGDFLFFRCFEKTKMVPFSRFCFQYYITDPLTVKKHYPFKNEVKDFACNLFLFFSFKDILFSFNLYFHKFLEKLHSF